MSGPPVPLRLKLFYGLGAVAYGIKDNGFSVFLLIFYNQVVGLPAGAVGAAIGLALAFDALIDPLLGVLSDRTQSRWGRRHPWLYASALPIALTWLLLWYPPRGTEAQLLGYLVVVTVLARAAVATNEVSSYALAPELTLDYHERTAVMRYRYLFGWLGGMAILILAYGVFIGPATGAAALAGYQAYARTGAIVMAVTVVVSALGTHRALAHAPAKPIVRRPVTTIVAEMRQTLSNRAFVTLMIAGIFAYTNQGVGFALSQYNLGFVWRFTTAQYLIYAAALLVGVVAIFLAVTPITVALGKIRAAAMFMIVSAVFVCAPYLLRLAGLMPVLGSDWLLPAFLVLNTIGTASGIGATIVGASMMSDVVEAAEEATGRREEGLFFAGTMFMQKCASGLGVFVSGLILAAAHFPEHGTARTVPAVSIDALTLLFCVATLLLSVVSALAFLRFPFGEAEHRARLAKLAVAASEGLRERG